MARYRYKSYRSRRSGRRRVLLFTLAAIIIIGAAVYIIRKSKGTDGSSLVGPAFNPDDQINSPEDVPDLEISRAEIDLPKPEPQPEPLPEPDIAGNTKSPEPDSSPLTTQQDTEDQNSEPTEDITASEVPSSPSPVQPQVQSDPEATALIVEAKQHIERGDIISARNKLNDALKEQLSPLDSKSVKKVLSMLSEQ